MIKKFYWLLPVLILNACNNHTPEQTKSEHTEHSRASAGKNYCDSVNNGLITVDTLKGSPHCTAMATVNGNHVHIAYNSPGVKGRQIWGGLVAYDKVWVTGAHNATSIQFSKDVEIGGKKVPAGKYAFFTIPGREKWTVILNRNYDQHLADEYDEKEDVMRIALTPEQDVMTPRLSYAVNKLTDTSGEITLRWEKIILRVPFVQNNL